MMVLVPSLLEMVCGGGRSMDGSSISSSSAQSCLMVVCGGGVSSFDGTWQCVVDSLGLGRRRGSHSLLLLCDLYEAV